MHECQGVLRDIRHFHGNKDSDPDILEHPPCSLVAINLAATPTVYFTMLSTFETKDLQRRSYDW
jgi:hypothetical protein